MQGIRRMTAHSPADGIDHATPKSILIWEEVMPTLLGFGTFAALPEEQISKKISRRILAGDQGMLVWRMLSIPTWDLFSITKLRRQRLSVFSTLLSWMLT